MPTCRLYRKYDISVKVINENRQTHTTNIMRFLDFAYCYLHIYIYILTGKNKQNMHKYVHCLLLFTCYLSSQKEYYLKTPLVIWKVCLRIVSR